MKFHQFFPFFGGLFRPPGSGSGVPMRVRSPIAGPDPATKINVDPSSSRSAQQHCRDNKDVGTYFFDNKNIWMATKIFRSNLDPFPAEFVISWTNGSGYKIYVSFPRIQIIKKYLKIRNTGWFMAYWFQCLSTILSNCWYRTGNFYT